MMINKLVIATSLALLAMTCGRVYAFDEKIIHDDILKNKKSQITLLEKLVNINSGTSNIQGVYRVGEIVKKQLDQLGFKTKWVYEPSAMKRAGTLIAKRIGKGKGDRLLLIAHLDTVFAKDSPFRKMKFKNNTATGPGVIDDKGGIVVMLYALKALAAAHVLEDATITVVLTGDEEDSGKPTTVSRKPLMEVAKEAEVALDFEPTISLETVSIARRGISHWTIESHGNESHSATIFLPDVGDGAIFESARVLNALRTQLSGKKYLTFNPGIVLAGNKVNYDKKAAQGTAFGKLNVVSKVAMASGDFRYIDTDQKKLFEDQLREITKTALPGTHTDLAFEDGIPAMPPTANNLALLKKYSDVSIACGYGAIQPLDAGVRGAGDISYVASMVPANLSGLGPLGYGTHSMIEKIDLNSLPVQTERAAVLMYRLIHHHLA